MKHFLLAAAVGCCLGRSSIALAQVMHLELTGDTFVNGNAPDTAFGADAEPLYVHNYGPKYTLLQFDSAPIAGARVLEARLSLTVESVAAPGTIELYPIVTSWDETTATYNNVPATETVPPVESTISADATAILFDMPRIAQRWADGTLPGAGILLRSDDAIRAVFGTKENGAGATLRVIVEFWEDPPEPGDEGRRRLDLTSVPAIIHEPGYYYLDRDWIFDGHVAMGGSLLTIAAADVTLDLQQHSLESTHDGYVIDVQGNDFTIRNGRLTSFGTALRSQAISTHVDRMSINSSSGIHFTERAGTLSYSHLFGRYGSSFADSTTIEFNEFFCALNCVFVSGERSIVRGNQISTDLLRGLTISGNHNKVIDNIVSAVSESNYLVQIIGNANQLLDNNVMVIREVGVAVLVDGTGNVIDGTNVLPMFPNSDPNGYGIQFLQDGNYYGNNRMRSNVPYDLGGTVQIDWGGNVAY